MEKSFVYTVCDYHHHNQVAYVFSTKEKANVAASELNIKLNERSRFRVESMELDCGGAHRVTNNGRNFHINY